MRDVLVAEGTRFFENVLTGLPEFGVDIRDPFQVLLGIRRIGAQRLENLYHPLDRDRGQPNEIAAYSPTEFIKRARTLINDEIEAVHDRGLAKAVNDRSFIVASGDTHFYGKFVLGGVLRELGAEVIDAGVGCDPEALVGLLDGRSETTSLAVSLHNGQCLAYSKRLMEILTASGRRTDVFVGGRLNAIFPGESEPRDAVAELREIGVVPCATVSDLVEHSAP
jgi:methylmalonyl-CoA mutase cobalamin-binding subunit